MGYRIQLCCPACGADSDLHGEVVEQLGSRDAAGDISCRTCARAYPVIDGIPMLFVDDHDWRSKQRESAGWEAFAAERGELHYEGVGAPPVDFVIPHIDAEPWATYAKSFDQLCAGLDLEGKVVLDIGSGRPWAAKQFALRGAVAAAMDVNPHPVVGVGRGWEMAREAGVQLDLFVGDSEKIPIADASVDVTFISAAMHHTNFLRRLAREMARVLKPGGVALIANEPIRSVTADEGDVLLTFAEPELRHGITERRPLTSDYLHAMTTSGFVIENMFLGPDTRTDEELLARISAPVVAPAPREWLSTKAPRRFARAAITRWQHIGVEFDARRALPKGKGGVRRTRLQRHAAIYGNPDINLVARKTGQ